MLRAPVVSSWPKAAVATTSFNICLGGAERYMENYAIVKVDKDKIDRTKFKI